MKTTKYEEKQTSISRSFMFSLSLFSICNIEKLKDFFPTSLLCEFSIKYLLKKNRLGNYVLLHIYIHARFFSLLFYSKFIPLSHFDDDDGESILGGGLL